MSDTIQELADIPRDFLRDGMLFVRRCTKPDKREFIKISQAVGMGFIIMEMLTLRIAIGYFIKLIHIPVNNILVGGA
ncbi:secE/sec61-gamma protein [Aspergillus udagawae]|uniref:SecE/sec61-gamma protein n=1 Tax=Aspergillus udagawae TaxID=91492 RepID=A0A8H3RJM2_9EURO|nr:secE/sec61-gamma protein [Aspergillus udagawae]GFF31308.1 secE/sec61-gamma protein [Aspergillus udagawae]GFG21405.1 secE/sec61-gamma protein [Aspergillus udagawae]